jgi:hypothetical protein
MPRYKSVMEMMDDLTPCEYDLLFTYFIQRQWGPGMNDWYEARKVYMQSTGNRTFDDFRLMGKKQEKQDFVDAMTNYLNSANLLSK